MSYPNLLSRRMGFPYPSETYMIEDERLFCQFTKGRNRIMLPVLKKFISIQGTELYQPIFIGNIDGADSATVKTLYDTKYVHDNCISWKKGIGKIFINSDSKLSVYSRNPSREWIPKRTYRFEDLWKTANIDPLSRLLTTNFDPSNQDLWPTRGTNGYHCRRIIRKVTWKHSTPQRIKA